MLNLPKPPAGAWKLVKDIVADTVGPMALLGVAAGKFVSASAGAALNAEKMRQALAAVDGVEKLKIEFEQLLGSSRAATAQIEMLANVASQGAFTMPALAEASKNLQVLTNGALNTEAALKKVQDSAAASGTPVDVMATSMGELYSALQRADGTAGSAADMLARMGAISQSTASQVAGMSKAGVGVSAAWKVVEQDLNRSRGAASDLGGTISGLSQQLEEVQRLGNSKIGEIFASGAKAGLEAAIAFEEFKNKVAEANAAPWAALTSAMNNVKKSAADLLNSIDGGTIKTVFQTLGTVAIGVLAALVVGFLALGKAALDAALKIKVVQAALAGVGKWGKMWAGMSVGIAAVTTAMAALIAAFVQATERVKALNEERKKLKMDGAKNYGELYGQAQTATTPEQRKEVESNIDARIKEARDKRDEFANSRRESEERMTSWNPFVKHGFNKKAISEAEMGMQEQDARVGQLEALKTVMGDSDTGGVDKAMLDVSRQRLEIEREILKAARDRLQESATPEMASKMAGDRVGELENKLKTAEETQAAAFEDAKNLEAETKIADDANNGRTDLVAAATRNAEMEATLGGKPVVPDKPGLYMPEDFRGTEKQAAEYKSNEEKIKAAANERADFSNYDNVRDNAKSDLGRLQAERAKRQAMLNEKGKAAGDLAQLTSMGAGDDAIAAAKSRLDSINQQLGDLTDLKTGAKLGFDDKGNAIGVRGDTLQAMDTEIQTSASDADSNKIRQELEAARIRKQTADEALAQDKASIEASQRRLSAEKQIAALKNAGGEGAAAQVEFDSANEGLQKRLKAVKELEAAEEKFRNSKKGESDVAALDQARVAAMQDGYVQGDSSNSVQLEMDQAKQVLEIRKQIAEIEKASAENKRNELMQEYRMQQQLLQLRLNDAKGEKGGKTENDVAREERQRVKGKLQKALPLVAQRDALVKSAESGTFSKAQADQLNQINKELAALGIQPGQTEADIRIQIKAAGMEEAKALIEEVENRKRAATDMQMDMYRTIEQYGTGDQAFQARQKRLDIQQQSTYDQKYKEYKAAGYSGDDSKALSSIESQRERLADELAYEGKPRVDSLTAVGGGSGFVGLTGSQDKMDRLAQLAEQQKAILDRIAQQNEQSLQAAQAEINKNSF
jgi:hypothetical protein